MITFASLYAGAGGLDLGFVQAGFTPLWTNEISKDATDTYSSVIPGHQIIQGDLCNVKLPIDLNPNCIIGGPPCQGFSVAGRMDPQDPRSKHVWKFLDVVQSMNPECFVMENVKALFANSRWESLRKSLIFKAEEFGYFTSMYLLNSANFGVPQLRERMFLVGCKSKYIAPPGPTHVEANFLTVRDALKDLPTFGTLGNDSMCTAKVQPAKSPILRKSPYAGMLFNGQGRPLDLDRPALTLPASMGGNRTPIIDQDELDFNRTPWVRKYHSHLCTGGESASKAPEFLRRLTVEEAARLQSFPGWMKFTGSQSSQFRQIGNAVPPKLAFAVAQSLKDQLSSNFTPSRTLFTESDKICYMS